MIFRKFALAAVTVAVLAPALANAASPEKTSLAACAKAFATSLASPGAAVPTFKVAYRGDRFASSAMSFFPSEYTFFLEAHDPKTGVSIARAQCSTDIRGTVTALSAVPVEAPKPTLAAQF